MDHGLLDRLVSGAGCDAQLALERFRDNHAFDPEQVLATELYIALDEARDRRGQDDRISSG